LVKSHACGTGEEVPLPVVKLMLLLKFNLWVMDFWNSIADSWTINCLYNHDVLPVIYTQDR
jgi:histidine ammonia-lyase